METVQQLIDEGRTECIDTLKRWIAIPSVKTAPEPGAPFGTEVARALDTALSDAQRM